MWAFSLYILAAFSPSSGHALRPILLCLTIADLKLTNRTSASILYASSPPCCSWIFVQEHISSRDPANQILRGISKHPHYPKLYKPLAQRHCAAFLILRTIPINLIAHRKAAEVPAKDELVESTGLTAPISLPIRLLLTNGSRKGYSTTKFLFPQVTGQFAVSHC